MRVLPPAAGPLFPAEGPRLPRLLRRARGITVEVVAFVLITALFPLLILLAAAVDLVIWLRDRRPWAAVRLLAMAWWFLFGELWGIAAMAGIWLVTGGPFGTGSLRRRRLSYAWRVRWATSHLGGVRVLFSLRFEVEGLESVAPGPVLIMMRHTSIIDNMLPDTVITKTHGIGLRFLLKRELESLPIIDIGGRWVPTCYVRRASSDSDAEIAALRRLAQNLGSGEGILIYPEGTRYTPAKLARAQEVIAERQPAVVPLAARLRNVLPPRLGGTLALLEEAAGVDVVLCGHVGFDGFQYVSDVWRGGLVGSTIRIRFWRHSAASIPAGGDARIAWLYGAWQELDDWVGAQRGRPPAEPPPSEPEPSEAAVRP